jgi:hypothetical protein
VRAVFESETAQPLGAPAEGRNPSQITNQPTSQRDQGRFRLDNTGIRYMVLNRANYVFTSFRSPELRQPI